MFRWGPRALLFRAVPTLQPVNLVHLVGVAHDIQHGFIGDDAVTQFQLSVVYAPVETDAPTVNPLPDAKSPAARGVGGVGGAGKAASTAAMAAKEREFFTVRCGDMQPDLRATLSDGAVVAVRGALKINMQPEPAVPGGKLFAFPFINAPSSAIEILAHARSVRSKPNH